MASCPRSGAGPLGLGLCLLLLQVPPSSGSSGLIHASPERPSPPTPPSSPRPPTLAVTAQSPAPRGGGSQPVPARTSRPARIGSLRRGSLGWQRADELPTLLEGCGLRDVTMPGENSTLDKKWPWQVSLQTSGEHVCGGTLIAPRWVLTAAQCISSLREYMVLLGDTNRYGVHTVALYVPVQDIILHHNFGNRTMHADIALILLSFPVNYTSWVRPVCLPAYAYEVKTNSTCWMTGWSILDNPEAIPVELQESKQTIVQDWAFVYIFDSSHTVGEGMICTNNEKNSTCFGDYGGPLVCEINGRWFQVGIMSWFKKYSPQELSSVYTEVSFYKEWITDHMLLSFSNSVDFFLSLFLVLPSGILVTLDLLF